MKITRVLQQAITEEVEITFPFYRKQQELFYYYAIDENNVIQVAATDSENIVQISKQILCIGNVFHPDSDYITKEEFEAKYNEAIYKLTNLINKQNELI